MREEQPPKELHKLSVECGEYIEEGEESLHVVEREGLWHFFGIGQQACGGSERGWMVTMYEIMR